MRKKNSLRRWLIGVPLIVLALVLPRTLIADDDEYEEHEGRGHHGHHGHRDKGGRREGRWGGLSETVVSYRQLESLPENPTYKAECTSCHMAYHPGLLPARSWSKIMQGLSDHFGENASLDAKTAQELTAYLTAHAADKAKASRRSTRIAESLSATEAPVRITDTSIWTRWHHEVRAEVWKRKKVASRSNCIACHGEAEKGYFDEHTVKIPRDEPPGPAAAVSPKK